MRSALRAVPGPRTAADRADRLVKALFDSVAQLPAPDHLVGLAHELDARRTRAA